MLSLDDNPQARDPILMDILEGRFSSPSGNYFWHRKREKVLRLFNQYLDRIEPKTTTDQPLYVELGCGQAVDLYLIREAILRKGLSWRMIGIEIVPTLLQICNLKKQWLHADDVSFMPTDLTKPLPFDDNSVDLIYTSEVIEHLASPEFVFSEVRRVLKKPHGCLLMTTPNEPNVFQPTYWDKGRYDKLKTHMAELREQQVRTVESGGGYDENVDIYGHISLRKISEWDQTLHQIGFKTIDYERGATVYDAGAISDNAWTYSLQFLTEAILDCFPKSLTRNLSDQLIGLYQVTTY